MPRVILALALITSPLAAQTAADRAEVLKPINQLFDAMRKHDSAAVRGAFAEQGRLVGVSEKNGQLQSDLILPVDFAHAVGRAAGGPPWDERIYDPEVKVDGRLATVWAAYDFLAGDKWSHCGIDAFMLAKLAEGWKITQIADTRRTTGCTTPAAPH